MITNIIYTEMSTNERSFSQKNAESNWGEPERAPLLRGKRYGGPCAKNRSEKRHCKHDKLTDTSIQVLCIVKISVFMS